LLTLATLPVLVWMYVRLARSEAADSRARFGEAYAQILNLCRHSFPI
jgi:protein-S-isoprenylcysteine O-methyltransferase Ste14